MGTGVSIEKLEKLVKGYFFEPILSELENSKKLTDPPEVDLERLKGYKTALKRG